MHRNRPKTLFICKKRLTQYGNSFGLVNSAHFVSEYLRSIGIESDVVTVTDGNDIDRVVTEYNPTHIFIHALFITPAKMYELLGLTRHMNRNWVVRIHSKTPFLANEGIAMQWIGQYTTIQSTFSNFKVSANSTELNNDLHDILKTDVEYLPNIYQKIDYGVPDKPKLTYSVNVGCFGSIRPMKNHLIQAMAAIKFAKSIDKNLFFHVNGDRFEQQGDNVYKNLSALFDYAGNKYTLVTHPWMDHSEFISIVKTMDIGMQVSLSESFNIVAADFVSNGIPLVGSPDITQLSGQYQADPNSSENICDKLKFAYRMRRMNTHWFNNKSLDMHNNKAMKTQRKYLCVR